MDPRVIDDIAKRLTGAMPERLRSLQEDVEQNFKAVLQSTFDRLDLVTREEFEVKSAMLEKTRATLRDLEARLQELEDAAAEGAED